MTLKHFAAGITFSGFATSAVADVTAVQVWEDWLSGIEASGSSVSAIQNRSAGQLTLDDFVVSYQDADLGISFELDIGQAALVENSDGSVSITLPQRIPANMEFRDNYSQVSSISAMIGLQNMQARASGERNQITYDYSADSIALALQSLIGEGEQIGRDEVQLSVVGNRLSASTTSIRSEFREVIGRSTLDELQVMVMLAPKGADFSADWTAQINSLTIANSGQTPEGVSLVDVSGALKAGLNSTGVMSYRSGESKLLLRTPDGDFSMSTNSNGANSSTSMSQDGMSMLMDVNGANFDVFASTLPLPINGTLGSFVYGLNVPLMPRSEDQAFGLRFELNDLAMAESLWAMFDPGEVLPRDPISLRIDISGMAKLFLDYLDAEQLEASLETLETPGELSSLTLNALDVRALGADLSVQGDFDIDNDNLSVFDGFPTPTGRATATLSGANALLDRLTQMGLIAGEQVMGARMFMGMFALPVGRDQFETEVEIDAEGGVFVNQQRFR